MVDPDQESGSTKSNAGLNCRVGNDYDVQEMAQVAMQREEVMRISLQDRLDEQARELEETTRHHKLQQQAIAGELQQVQAELKECRCTLEQERSRASSSAMERESERERATEREASLVALSQDAERAHALAREGEHRSAQLAQEKTKLEGDLSMLRERVEKYELRLEEGEEEVRKLEEQLVLLLVRQPRSPAPR